MKTNHLTLKQWMRYGRHLVRKSIFNWAIFENPSLPIMYFLILVWFTEDETNRIERICVDSMIRNQKLVIP